MEYFLGSLITLMSLFIFTKIVNHKIPNSSIPVPKISQSIVNNLLGFYHKHNKVDKKRQSSSHEKRNSIKAFFWNNDVYWIEDGFLVTAKLEDNKIDEKTKKRVDTYNLDRVELDRIEFIVDKLAEGNKDDSGNSGK